jgi:hypothetical protein
MSPRMIVPIRAAPEHEEPLRRTPATRKRAPVPFSRRPAGSGALAEAVQPVAGRALDDRVIYPERPS